MKVIKTLISAKTKEGEVILEAEEDEDMYHLYNLIMEGDEVEAKTIRNVVTESKTGARDKARIQTIIAIRVERIEFDAEVCTLRLNGSNVKENEHIKLGQHHTLEIEVNRSFKITKSFWDSIHLELLQEMCDPMRKADIAALVMQEGLAHLCLIKSTMTKTCAKIEKAIPKKKQGNVQFDKAMEKFFEDIYVAIERHINFDVVKVLLVGSPGFLNEDFMKYALDRAVREEGSNIFKNKSKFLKVHSSSGFKNAIEELLATPETIALLSNVKAVDEVKALSEFHTMLTNDPERACYGLKEVLTANEQIAIDQLLITDTMYRCGNFIERKKYVDLIDSVRASGGRVFKFSSLHVSGEQLNNYTGIAAILRFPIPDIDEFEG